MRMVLFALCLLVGIGALAVESVKVVVGHQCCGGCANALIAGAKTVSWVDAVAVNGTTATITAKAEQPVEYVSLLDGMRKAGFPAKELLVATPITLSIAHLCCGGCVNGLKQSITASLAANLDKGRVVIDTAAHTATLQPVAGQSLNLVALLRSIEDGGFSASKIVVSTVK